MKPICVFGIIMLLGVVSVSAQAQVPATVPADVSDQVTFEETVAAVSATPTSVVSKSVMPSSVPVTRAHSQNFRHLHVFSFGGLMVLLFLFIALSCDSVWTCASIIAVAHWGWIVLPDNLAWLQSLQAWYLAIILGVLAIIFGVIPNLIPVPSACDVAVVLGVAWLIINGVFVDTDVLGRLFLISSITVGSVALGAVSNALLPAYIKVLLPAGTFISMVLICIWL